jgi:hypothetical protein
MSESQTSLIRRGASPETAGDGVLAVDAGEARRSGCVGRWHGVDRVARGEQPCGDELLSDGPCLAAMSTLSC